jgi:hypothetical protein
VGGAGCWIIIRDAAQGRFVFHDPRHLKFFVVVYLYLTLGLLTGNRIVGGLPLPGESPAMVVLGNALLIPLAIAGIARAWRTGRFLTFDKWLWAACTFGCYGGGALVARAMHGR